MYIINAAAAAMGCDANALKLLFSLIIGYPICILYNIILVKQPLVIKNAYFALAGLSIGFFNYGFNILHTTLTIVTVHIFMNAFKGKLASVLLTFSFCTFYLLWGYWKTQSDEYSFHWTIPHCILTLRLIAVAFDVYDGHQLIKLEKVDNVPNAKDIIKNDETLSQPPGLLQLLGHCYFPASFLVGPQYGIKRYMDFVKGTESFVPMSLGPAFQNLFLGLAYLMVFQVGTQWFPSKYLMSPEFNALDSFWKQSTVIAITCKIQLCKYVCIWSVSEGCCIASGLTYDKNKKSFRTIPNIHVYDFETTPTFSGLITSFNVSTNQWAAKYLFKRLRFLGSKFLSHLVTLLYLALWHGWRSGYYVTFTMEFLIIKMEREVINLIEAKRRQHRKLDAVLNANFVRWPIKVLCRVWILYMFGYCLVSFILLTRGRWLPVLQQVYFYGHVIYLPGQLLIPVIKLIK
ncbi:Lysophospholipid acyltransferase 5 [Halotydeus destructor]|nr:Lysophospholipid acyltransferase 5 [Halotydeus destructor]